MIVGDPDNDFTRLVRHMALMHPGQIFKTPYVGDDKVYNDPEACKQCGDWFWYGHTNPWKRKDINRIIIIPGGRND